MKKYELDIIFTNKCNLRCKYCYTHKDQTVMSDNVYQGTLSYVKNKLSNELSKDDTLYINLFGGEPLMAYNLVMRFLADMEAVEKDFRNFIIVIFTNGILINDELLDVVKSKTYIKFNFSLDGGENAHNATRVYADGRGSFDDVYNQLKYVANYMNTTVEKLGFKMVVSPDNFQYLTSSAKFFLDEGITRLAHSFDRGNSWTKQNLIDFEIELNKLADFYISNIDKGLNYHIFSYPIMDYSYKSFSYCGAGRSLLSISPEGDLYPCSRFYSNGSGLKLGDILNGVNNSNPFVSFFKNYTVEKNFSKCKSCDIFRNCNCLGQCLAAMYENESLTSTIDSVCDRLKITYKVSLRCFNALKNNENYIKTITK